MPTREQFVDRLRDLTAGTPYAVEQTADGAVLTVDLDDPRWHSQLRREVVREIHRFALSIDSVVGSIAVRETAERFDWSPAGLPEREGVPMSVSTSRFEAPGHDWTSERRDDFTFSSAEGRTLIETVAEEQEWFVRRGQPKIGAFVLVALGVMLLLAIAMLFYY